MKRIVIVFCLLLPAMVYAQIVAQVNLAWDAPPNAVPCPECS